VSAPCKNFVVDKKEEATLATVGVFIRWYVKVLPDFLLVEFSRLHSIAVHILFLWLGYSKRDFFAPFLDL